MLSFVIKYFEATLTVLDVIVSWFYSLELTEWLVASIWSSLPITSGVTQFILLLIDPLPTSKMPVCRVWQSYDTGFDEFFPGSHMVKCALVNHEFAALEALDE